MPDTEAVKKSIVGVCEEISEKNGWTSFAINVGSQYPIRLSTKLPALIEQARAVGSETATWTFKESQGGENPNKPGTYYMNRYLESAEVNGAASTASGGGPQTRPTESAHEPLAIGDRERSIVRQACLKAAATVYAGKGTGEPAPATDDTPLTGDPIVLAVIEAAHRFETWVLRDLVDLPF